MTKSEALKLIIDYLREHDYPIKDAVIYGYWNDISRVEYTFNGLWFYITGEYR